MKKITKIMTSMVAILALAASMSVASFAEGEDPDVAVTIAAGEEITDTAVAEVEDGAFPEEGEEGLGGPVEEDVVYEGTDGEVELEDTAAEGENEADVSADDTTTGAGDTTTGAEGTTADDKGSPDTGVEGVAGIAGIAVLAGGTLLLVSKKKN